MIDHPRRPVLAHDVMRSRASLLARNRGSRCANYRQTPFQSKSGSDLSRESFTQDRPATRLASSTVLTRLHDTNGIADHA